MHSKNIVFAGKRLEDASKALIMLHGRGASAQDILDLAPYLNVRDFALIAPEATNNTWYPHSFMAKPEQNEPWLSSALDMLKEVMYDLTEGEGMTTEDIYFLGFSQGACLSLEFIARNAARFGGVVAFTGGLIGEKINRENYSGNFGGTPVFIGTGNPDPHVPLERVRESAAVLGGMNANVHLEIYEGRPHSVSQNEIDQANVLIFKK